MHYSKSPPPDNYKRTLEALAPSICELIRSRQRETGLRHVATVDRDNPEAARSRWEEVSARYPDLPALLPIDPRYRDWLVVVMPEQWLYVWLVAYRVDQHREALLDVLKDRSALACLFDRGDVVHGVDLWDFLAGAK